MSSSDEYLFQEVCMPLPRLARTLLLSLPLLFFSGCLQSETVVTVFTDGSGSIEEGVMVRDDLVGKLQNFLSSIGAEAETTVVSEKRLRERARELGEGVSYVSVEERTEGGFRGYRARYSFTDVTRLRVSRSGGKPFGLGSLEGVTGGEGDAVTFGFTPGKPARLVIRQPGTGPGADGSPLPRVLPEGGETDPGLLQGARVRLTVAVKGRVTESSATYRDGERITLVDLDLDRLLKASPEGEQLEAAGIPGLRAEPKREIFVLFR
jgi:hypothetical protein